MYLPFFIAKKYFWSRKKKNFINVISMISVFVVAVGTMALVVVLSVVNGLEDLVRSLYNSFDPDIKIELVEGKSFEIDSSMIHYLEAIEGVDIVAEIIEDNAYVKYNEAEMVAVIKGVSKNFVDIKRLESHLLVGDLDLTDGELNYGLVGQGVEYSLSIDPANEFNTLQLFYPRNMSPASLNPAQSMRRKNIMVGGVFALEKKYDEKYIFVPLRVAQELLEYGNKRTSLEVMLAPDADLAEAQEQIKEFLGPNFQVLTSDEQHAEILRTVKIEKLFIFITFIFILAISSFNIFFALSMLAIDKRKDIAVLASMGASNQLIKRIFLAEGALISFSGASIGLLAGFVICLLQQRIGLIPMGLSMGIVEFYPVKMITSDFVFTALGIAIITFMASFRPSAIAGKFANAMNLQ